MLRRLLCLIMAHLIMMTQMICQMGGLDVFRMTTEGSVWLPPSGGFDGVGAGLKGLRLYGYLRSMISRKGSTHRHLFSSHSPWYADSRGFDKVITAKYSAPCSLVCRLGETVEPSTLT